MNIRDITYSAPWPHTDPRPDEGAMAYDGDYGDEPTPPLGTPAHASPSPRSAPGVLLAHDVGLLVLRLGVGLIIAGHGAQHLFGWWSGPGIHRTGLDFAHMGSPAPRAMAVIA